MEAGRLRHRVKLQRYDRVSDGMGGYEEQWVDVATVWASVEPLQGRERFEAQQVQATTSHRVRMRYRSDVKPEMRVLFGSRILHIQAVVDPQERHRELQLLCEEEQ